MKFNTATSLLVLAGIASANPIFESTRSSSALGLNATEFQKRQLPGYCYIRSYSEADCKGANLFNYEYATGPEHCRSCERWDNSHSFTLVGDCPSGYFSASPDECNKRNRENRFCFNGAGGCFNVNTGKNWVTGYPCFNVGCNA